MAKRVLFFLLIAATNSTLALLSPFSISRLYLVLLLYVLGTGVTLYLLVHPRNSWLIANRSQVDSPDSVALTFDDGPDPVDTPKLLDILLEKGVKATFFVVGKRAEQHPEILRRALDEGHLIANHTWSHSLVFCFLMPRRLRAEIQRGTEVVYRICGFRPRYFRSPVGLRHPLLGSYLEQEEQEYISWRVRSYDTVIKNPSMLSRRILKQVRGGDIILLHDHLPSGASAMLEVLPDIIDTLRARGLEFVLVGYPKVVDETSLQTICSNKSYA